MRWALCAIAAGMPACMPEIDDAVVVHGRHVTVHADPAIPVCAKAVAAADRFVEDTAAMLGVAPRPIDYNLYDGSTGCGTGQYADASCVIDGTVYANAWIHFHELVHAVDATHPPALFVEGLAEALSIPSDAARATTVARATAPLVLESPAFRAGLPAAQYRIAGDFVRYLVERFGGARYAAFAHSLGALADAITIRQMFARVYPVSLDEVIASWRVAPPAASTLVVPADFAACADPVAPVGYETWEARDLGGGDCRSGETPGGTIYVQHPRRIGFEVGDPGLFVIALDGDAHAKSLLRRCAGFEHEAALATRFTVLALDAGRHAVDAADGVAGVRVERLGAVARACEAAPVLEIADDAWTLELRGPPGTWLAIDYRGTRELVGAAAEPARACSSCTACRWFTDETPLDHVVGRPLLVELGPSRSVVIGTAGDQKAMPIRGPATITGSVAP